MTNTVVYFDLLDTTAKADSTPVASSQQSFCDIGRDLLLGVTPQTTAWATLEPDSFLLDGSRALLPDDRSAGPWGLWSAARSDAAGVFTTPPVLQVDFSIDHSSAGITLHFWAALAEWASELKIQWYDSTGSLLAAAQFSPDTADYFCEHKVERYRRIRITFTRTNLPGRYLKLVGIDYGAALTFTGDDVIKASVVEEVDLLSDEITINTLELSLHNKNGYFSILSADGSYGVLQERQQLRVVEEVDGAVVPMGTFYLSEWQNDSDTQAAFTAQDAVGLLDAAPWEGGIYNTTMGAFLAELLAGYAYELDSSLAALPICGYLAADTKRTALQQAAFACGAVVDCSRSEKIRIYAPPERPSTLITKTRKFASGGKISLTTLTTGVSVTCTTYTEGTEAEELYSEELPAGVTRIELSEPASGYSVSGATLLKATVNCVDVSVTTAGKVTLTGKKYLTAATTTKQAAAELPANAQPNVLAVDKPALLPRERAAAVAAGILARCADRVQVEWRMVAGQEVLGDRVIIDSHGSERVRGSISKMSIDLTGGFIASCTLSGSRIDTTSAIYSGEAYAGERGVI